MPYLNMEIPYTGRAIINDSYNGIGIIVPTKKNWAILIFLGIWLCGWLGSELFVLSQLFTTRHGRSPDGLVILWLCGWTVGGVFAVSTWWWNVAGKEVITLSPGVLTIAKKGSIAKTRSYDLLEAKNFRASEDSIDAFGFGGRRQGLRAPWNPVNNGTIKFDYGMETVKFGDRLYQAEAEYILAKLRSKKLIP